MKIRDLPLVDYEHQLNYAFMLMENKGIHVDQEYAEGYLSDTYRRRHREAKEICKGFGLDNFNSSKQVATCLLAHGAELTKRTKTGFSTDKEVMADLILDGGEVAVLAQAVQDAKSALGFKTKYVDKVLAALDPEGRVHPSHMSLQARTARTSVSDPPLHQLPSRDNPGGRTWEIRRMFDATPGHVLIAVDFDQIELVVLAAICKDKALIRAIQQGADLHQITADAAGVPRPVGKMANFLMVYGGGAVELVRRAKMVGHPITHAEAVRTIKAFHRLYPGVGRMSRQIQQAFHSGRKHVVTATGRRLPLDRHRVYAGTNYKVQSLARDVFGQGCINLRDSPDWWQYVILTIHDEYLAEVPIDLVDDFRREVPKVVSIENFMNMEINVTGGASEAVPTWGHLYLDKGEVMPV